MKKLRSNLWKILGVLALMTAAVAFAQDVAVNLSDGSTSNGAFLVDANGMSLYLFLADHGAAAPTCTGDCATNWPPLIVAGADAQPTVGDGVDPDLLGTIKRDDGTFQVTYAGYPLYHYAKDTKAGDVNGQGVGGKWYLVTAAGAGVGATMPQ